MGYFPYLVKKKASYEAFCSTLTTFTRLRDPSNLVLSFVLKVTMPSCTAYSVSSFPRRTFSPGCIFVPRWRTITIPGRTFCPPKSFTPSRLDIESPLPLNPPFCFTCAIGCNGRIIGERKTYVNKIKNT